LPGFFTIGKNVKRLLRCGYFRFFLNCHDRLRRRGRCNRLIVIARRITIVTVAAIVVAVAITISIGIIGVVATAIAIAIGAMPLS